MAEPRASAARLVADATVAVLLDAVTEGSLAAGVAADLARRIADGAAYRGADLDDLGRLLWIAGRT